MRFSSAFLSSSRLGAFAARYSRQVNILKKPFTRLLFLAVERIGDL
jgi:hypothetical protein